MSHHTLYLLITVYIVWYISKRWRFLNVRWVCDLDMKVKVISGCIAVSVFQYSTLVSRFRTLLLKLFEILSSIYLSKYQGHSRSRSSMSLDVKSHLTCYLRAKFHHFTAYCACAISCILISASKFVHTQRPWTFVKVIKNNLIEKAYICSTLC